MATTASTADEPRLSVRVPQHLYQRLAQRASAEDRTMSSYVRKHLLDTLGPWADDQAGQS